MSPRGDRSTVAPCGSRSISGFTVRNVLLFHLPHFFLASFSSCEKFGGHRKLYPETQKCMSAYSDSFISFWGAIFKLCWKPQGMAGTFNHG